MKILSFFTPLSALAIALSACTMPASQSDLARTRIAAATTPCEASNNPLCVFKNSPVAMQPTPVKLFLRKNPFYKIAKPLEFIDASNQKWVAPRDTLTDGASIPTIFIPIIGSPTSPEFINASAIHDAYCGIGNNNLDQFHADTWQNVHRVFYDALRVGGTPEVKAKIMFAAVYLGGPRWYTPGNRIHSKPLLQSGVSPSAMKNRLREAMAYIETENPTRDELEMFLQLAEIKMLANAGVRDEKIEAGITGYPDGPYDDPYGPYGY